MSHSAASPGQKIRLHDAATTLPVPTGTPSAQELELSSRLPQDTEAVLLIGGSFTGIDGPIVLHGYFDYTTDSGVADNQTVQTWAELEVLSTASITGPIAYEITKLSPHFKALRVSTGSITGTVDVDILKEQGAR